MQKRKAQSSMEFILIFVFVFFLIAFLMYGFGYYAVDNSRKASEAQLENFAKSIETESNILQQAQEGYYREVEIPAHLVEKYNVSLVGDFLALQNIEAGNENVFYFSLSGDNLIRLVSEDKDGDTINETYLVLEKGHDLRDEDYLLIGEINSEDYPD